MRPFIDTNVWVYAVDADEPEKRGQALDLLRDVGRDAVISAQVMSEFHVTVTRKLARPLHADVAKGQVQRLAQLTVVPTDHRLVLDAIDLADRHQMSLWDAMILRAAVTGGCDVVYTEDLADGAELDGITITNPFRDG
ncbi:PIN domain-containing protein [Euzebya sp.]|uniref:PIN domain-containing protein n=1 Tax=Euzebya sp. TaxID=1971409 RepID=UPI003511D70F